MSQFRSEIYQEQITTQPAVEPVDLNDVKRQLNIDTSDTTDDTLLTDYITAARREVENKLNRTLITTEYTMKLDFIYDTEIRIPSSPLISVTSFDYIDTSGNSQSLVEGTDFKVCSNGIESVLTPEYNILWPDTRDEKEAVTIVYDAGYGAAASDVPQEIRTAITMVVADLYRLREAASCAEQYVNKRFENLLGRETFRRLV